MAKRKRCDVCSKRLSYAVGFVEARVWIPGDDPDYVGEPYNYGREVDLQLCLNCAPSYIESVARAKLAA
jgi:hypothetical protein